MRDEGQARFGGPTAEAEGASRNESYVNSEPSCQDILTQLLQPEGGIEFKGVDVLRLRGPVVYLVMRGNRPMYVGMSARGLTRPFNSKHHVLNQIHEDDKLQVWPTVGVLAARDLECLLIERLQPEWNERDRNDLRPIALRLGVSEASVRRMRRERA